jgi:hypothetical protein
VSSVNRDLFISHSSGDAEVARALRAELEDAGYTCWLAPDDVVGTSPWAEQILAAIAGSRAMLVLVSERSNRSQHVSREVGLANGRNRAIIPVRIEHVPIAGSLEYHLEGLQRIDAFPPPITDHIPRILRRLSMIVPLDASSSGASSDAMTTVSPVFAAPLAAPEVSTDTERVHVAAPPPPPVVVVGAAATPVASRRPRWVAPSSGLSVAVLTLLALIAVGTGVFVFGPAAAPSTSAPGSNTAIGSPAQSQEPATLPPAAVTSLPSGTSPEPGSPAPSATAVRSLDPDPTPRRTPRPETPPPPTPKVTKKPTAPPPTPTPVPIVPARIVSHGNGSTIHGDTVTFVWSPGTGPKSVRFYGVYVGSSPPGDPCSGWCREPGDDAYALKDISSALGVSPTETSAELGNLPRDGSTIYVRLFTKYNPDTGVYAWRDYSFTSAAP